LIRNWLKLIQLHTSKLFYFQISVWH